MSISYSPIPDALCVDIQPSNYFRAALSGIAIIAFGAVFYASLAGWIRVLLVLSTFAYGIHCWRLHTRQRGMLRWRSSVWSWRGAGGDERALRLIHSTVWPGLIVLRFSCNENPRVRCRRNMVFTLFADSLEKDDARRLRVHLEHFSVFDAYDTDQAVRQISGESNLSVKKLKR